MKPVFQDASPPSAGSPCAALAHDCAAVSGYVLAVGLVAVATGIRLLFLQEFLGSSVAFGTFYPAVTLAALSGGFGPGMAATVVSAVVADYFWLEDLGGADWLAIAIFFFGCTLICVGAQAWQRARARAHDAELQLQLSAERERSSEAVAKAAELYRVLFQASSDGIVVRPFSSLGEQKCFTGFNDSFCTMLGYSSDEMLRLRPMDLLDPADESNLMQEIEILSRDRRLLFRKTLVARDGRRVPVEISTTLFDDDGQTMALSLVRDITERVRADNAIRETKRTLRLFIEHAPAALAMFDREMRYLVVSRRWRADFKLDDRDLTGLCHYEVIPDIPEKWKKVHRRALAGEVVRADRDRFERADGSVLWRQWQVHPWYGSDGAVCGIIIACEDITERVRGEERLRELSQRLTRHMDNSPLAVIEWGPDLRISRWSGAAESIFGWKPEEVLGKKIDDLQWVPAEDAAHVWDLVSAMHSGQPSSFSQNRNYTKEGKVIYCEWYNSSLFDDAGNLTSVLSLVLDVTSRTRLEEELQKNQATLQAKVEERTAELRAKDGLLLKQDRLAAMGEMVRNIAHQWRQPLNVLGLRIQQLSALCGTESTRDILDRNIDESMNLIMHMSQTIDDFRTFFKAETEKSAFCINRSIQRATNLIRDAFEHHRILTITHTSGEILVNGYPNEFAHAVLNLMQNAREAILERKTGDGIVTVVSSVANGSAVITIADNAGGIPEEIMDRVFEPYFSTKGNQGTGIGLYMTKTIIETNMGGRITVRNTEEGAEFRIELERWPQPEEETSAHALGGEERIAGPGAILSGSAPARGSADCLR